MDLGLTPDLRDFREAARTWLEENVPREPRPLLGPGVRDFDLAWQRRQFDGGWAGISWPVEYGGRGLTLLQQMVWFEEMAWAGAPYIGVCFVGINHAGPTLIARANEELKAFHLPRILRGETVWCQGFSEPGAGSDLASLSLRGEVDGDHLVVNGQKIWTSFAQYADYQELLVRTGRGEKAHQGITWIVNDMRLPGVTVRPITTMTGEPELAEVFYDDCSLPPSCAARSSPLPSVLAVRRLRQWPPLRDRRRELAPPPRLQHAALRPHPGPDARLRLTCDGHPLCAGGGMASAVVEAR